MEWRARPATEIVRFEQKCDHVRAVTIFEVERPAPGCEDCLLTGGRWIHLRTCLSCGHVGCCDSSPNRHATQHFERQSHPIITSAEPGESWVWCYADERGLAS